jgi:uncharacterized coiled-coil DUF342 family protein
VKHEKQNHHPLSVLDYRICRWLARQRLAANETTEKIEQAQASAEQYRESTEKINDSATEYLTKSKQLEKQITQLKKELANAKKNSPLPADCKPDADRLRVLKDAVRAANATAGQQFGS